MSVLISMLLRLYSEHKEFTKTLAFLLTVNLVLLLFKWRFVRVFMLTVRRDLLGLIRLISIRWYLYSARRNNLNVVKIFQENARKFADRTAINYLDERWTFAELDQYSNRVANYFIEHGFQRGDEVALLMSSRPEYIGIWLGLAKAGCIAALINNNQRQNGLVYSIKAINTKAVILDAEHSAAIVDVQEQLTGMQLFCIGQYDALRLTARPLDTLLEDSPATEPATVAATNFDDRLFYIYTSGTTGLPKAAIIKHNRYIWMGGALRSLIGLRKHENIYTCLPLYHLAGGCIGTSQCIVFGDTITVAPKFSASKFWSDCIKYKCTVAQYIGEICRYLLAQPVRTLDRQHSVRVIFGNGLRPKIWTEFVDRFGIESVGEFYGSTEGNANVINLDNQVGACGFISQILPSVYPVALIKVDERTGEPVRDEHGVCVRCGPNECGEFVGKIVPNDPTRAFDGYVNGDATKKKIVRDVFKLGDAAFLSGDLLFMDEFGYVYFRDRTGDTYRWKGENVSTTEVESVVSLVLGQVDCCCYGVEILGCEGRAGMIAIADPQRKYDLDQLLVKLKEILPTYSIPCFVRVVDEIEMTGTFKMPKNRLQSDGFNYKLVKDPLYYLNLKKAKYERIDETLYNDIISGVVKL